MTDFQAEALALGKAARTAARELARASTRQKDEALARIAARIRHEAPAILEANARDVARAREAGLTPSLLDRLVLDPSRLESVAAGVDAVRALPDPVGEVTE